MDLYILRRHSILKSDCVSNKRTGIYIIVIFHEKIQRSEKNRLATWLLLPSPPLSLYESSRVSALLPTSALTPLGHPHTLCLLKLRDRDRTTRDVIGEIVPSLRHPTLRNVPKRHLGDMGIPHDVRV